jgi:hypothetical protein
MVPCRLSHGCFIKTKGNLHNMMDEFAVFKDRIIFHHIFSLIVKFFDKKINVYICYLQI